MTGMGGQLGAQAERGTRAGEETHLSGQVDIPWQLVQAFCRAGIKPWRVKGPSEG